MPNPQDELEVLRSQVAALTERIYRLEQRTGMEPQIVREPLPPIASPPLPASPTLPAKTTSGPEKRSVSGSANPASWMLPPLPKIGSAKKSDDLEGTIGKLWLNRIGIIAILIGVSYFLKYAFDSGWIGAGGRVTIGLLAGIAVVVWSERFRSKGSAAFSYSLKAIGIGILYLSLWAASQRYELVPASVAFVAMIVVTASTITLALTQDAEILAVYAMIGGFSTPALVSTGENHEIVLFSYVCLLDLAILAMTIFKPWRRIIWGSVAGTALMYVGWYAQFYDKTERPITIFFSAAFFAIFATVPLVTPLTRSRGRSGVSITLLVLPFVNAGLLFLSLFAVYESETATLTWYSLALAAVYLLLASMFRRRVNSDADVVKTINLLHIAIGILFITIAVPLKLNQHWITIGWLTESAVLLWVAVKMKVALLRYFAGCTLALGVARLLFYDNFHTEALVFNARFATYMLAIAILGGIVWAGERYASEQEMPFVHASGVLLNLLALVALTLEANDYFMRQVALVANRDHYYARAAQFDIARDFSFSAIWILYGAALMVVGFWKRSAFIRWQALVLVAFTIGKVFLYDSRELEQIYRILSFIALGVVLMGISYAYHRDWLKLSPMKNNAAGPEASA